MSKVTNIRVSQATAQAVVVLENGDRHAFNFGDNYDDGLQEMLTDAKSGELSDYLQFFDSDSDDEIGETFAEATDWADAYNA